MLVSAIDNNAVQCWTQTVHYMFISKILEHYTTYSLLANRESFEKCKKVFFPGSKQMNKRIEQNVIIIQVHIDIWCGAPSPVRV